MHYLAVCVIVKDEDLYLREWVAYHALLGVEHFYIYDNGSASNQARCLEGFEAGLFTFISWPGQEMQMPAYNHCLAHFGRDCRWIAFIDVDEFICPLQDDSLSALLAEYEDYAGLAVPWLTFGSSGHLRRPEGLTIDNFRQTMPEELDARCNVIKCIVDPARMVKAVDPHRVLPKIGEYVVSEDHNPIPRAAGRIIRHASKVRINHYFFRSQEEFEAKLDRGRADRADAGARYAYEMFHSQARYAVMFDEAIQRFVLEVRAAVLDPDLIPATLGCTVQFHEIVNKIATLAAQGHFAQAESLLCATAESSKHLPDFWVMRAMFAREAGHLERALRFAYKALYYAEQPECYWEVFQSRVALGQMEDARKTLRCMQGFVRGLNAGHKPKAVDWQVRITEAQKRYFAASAEEGELYPPQPLLQTG